MKNVKEIKGERKGIKSTEARLQARHTKLADEHKALKARVAADKKRTRDDVAKLKAEIKGVKDAQKGNKADVSRDKRIGKDLKRRK
tara:strand:- start:611 stop:868 length:258 start_codon:yes stop_codon:yes gene_type:complete